jgi:hypothetical protein
MNFDWQTDEEDRWEEPEAAAEPAAEERSRFLSRRWLATGIVLLLAVGIGSLLYWQLKVRVDQGAKRVEEDVLATFTLVRSIAKDGDRELFVSVLSGRDPGWTSIQKDLMDAGALFDRSAFGFQSDGAEPAIVSVELSPDLMEAAVTSEEGYTIDVGNGVTESVRLQQTTVFRLGGQRWLLAPPENDFWGDWAVYEGTWLRLTYPERDAAIGERLGFDLDEKLGQMCSALPGLLCPPVPFHVHLDRSPAGFLALVNRPAFWAEGRIILPAPALVGLPLDEAGYQALYRGYAALVVSAAVTHLVEWPCCQHALFYEALLDKQLNQLGLRPWPLTAAGYETADETMVDVTTVETLWNAPYTTTLTAAERWQLRATVDFLLDRATSTSAAQMQRLMPAGLMPFRSWLLTLSQHDPDFDGLEGDSLNREWLAFVFGRSPAAHEPPPIPLPNQDILLLCNAGALVELHRYDTPTGEWHVELTTFDPYERMVALPGNQRIILEGHRTVEDQAVVSLFALWQAGQVQTAYWEASDGQWYSFLGKTNPEGQVLLLESPSTSRLLDLGSCGVDECEPAEVVPGSLTWSPDGQFTVANQLVFDGLQQYNLYLANGDGRPIKELEAGSRPFWLDGETFGYIRGGGLSGSALVLAGLEDEPAEVVLEREEVVAAVGDIANADRLRFYDVVVNPADTNQVALLARTALNFNDATGSHAYLLLWARSTGELRPLFELPDAAVGLVDFSPDGRWLMAIPFRDDTVLPGLQPVYLFDLEQGKLQTFLPAETVSFFQQPVWSADSHWLLAWDATNLTLLAPAYEYERPIFPPADDCNSAVWIAR